MGTQACAAVPAAYACGQAYRYMVAIDPVLVEHGDGVQQTSRLVVHGLVRRGRIGHEGGWMYGQ